LVSTSVRCSGTSGESLSSVLVRRGWSSTSGSNCLGRAGVLKGQKRDPMPPASTTAHSRSSAAVIVLARVVAHSGQLGGPRVELLRAERLRHEVGGAQCHRLPVLLLLTGRREDDARQLAVPLVAAQLG